MIKINWKFGSEAWAFRNLCKHLQKKIKTFLHIDNSGDDSDSIAFLVSPAQLKKERADSKTILHIDSNRWYK